MTNDRLTESEYAGGLLQLFPLRIRGGVAGDPAFRHRFNLALDAIIGLDDGSKFQRSQLFGAMRALFGGSAERRITATDGAVWTAALAQSKDSIELKRDDLTKTLPDFRCLSPDSSVRLNWFNDECVRFDLNDTSASSWRKILQVRAAEDDEVDEIATDIRLTPRYIAGQIADHLKGRTLDLRTLVPSDIRYFDRLVGEPGMDSSLDRFISEAGERQASWIQRDAFEGLQRVLLWSSSLGAARHIDLTKVSREDLLRLFEWLADRGDRISQIGAVECALANIDTLPELQPSLTKIVQCVLSEDPAEEGNRLWLISALTVMVDGELARTGIARKRPPFWRRLASIAHASVIERQLMAMGVPPASFSQKWAINVRWPHYYLQTFVDMRQERRWLPDFVLPDQLKAEFMGRIASAVTLNAGKIPSGELKALLLEDTVSGLQRQVHFPFAYLPGPIEGGTDSTVEMPPEIETNLRKSLNVEPLTPQSFASLVNSALIFRIGPQLAELAVEAIRRAKHQLRQVRTVDQAFSLLSGLATVAAVTRSGDLASEIRILVRVERRRPTPGLTLDNAMCIALIAAAAHADRGKWCDFVGDWVTELSFGEMTRVECVQLLEELQTLRLLEPHLWPTVAKADAALSALLQSFAA